MLHCIISIVIATRTRCCDGSQTADRGLAQEIQCSQKAQGLTLALRLINSQSDPSLLKSIKAQPLITFYLQLSSWCNSIQRFMTLL